jgi:hypothetical protein
MKFPGVRYFLSSDNDGHWYVIPESHRQNWDKWVDLDSDDEESWNVPEYAKEVNGSPSLVTFLEPIIR